MVVASQRKSTEAEAARYPVDQRKSQDPPRFQGRRQTPPPDGRSSRCLPGGMGGATFGDSNYGWSEPEPKLMPLGDWDQRRPAPATKGWGGEGGMGGRQS